MRKIALLLTVFVGFLAGNTGIAFGQNGLEWFKDIKVNGFVSTSYTNNFNDPSDKMNAIRIFDFDDNSFKLDVAELVFQKEAGDPGSIGFRFDLNYGFSVPSVEHSSGAAQSDDFDLQQGYASYVAPIGNGLTLDLGKFITHMGLEVIEGYDGWNYNYSRSILFGWAIPFTHTGLRASYSFNDMFSAMFMLANGWDNVTDNNDGKTFGFQLGITPSDMISVLLNFVGGPEQDNNDDNWRNVFDAVVIINPTDSLELQLNTDVGWEEAASALVPGNDANWWGFAGVVRYSLTDFFSINLRGEFFDDQDGARTGMSQELYEFTLTPEIILANNLIVRAEYRYDKSNVNYFNDNGTPTDSQNTIAINALFYF